MARQGGGVNIHASQKRCIQMTPHKHPAGLWDELGKLARITTDILDDTGASISAKPFAASLWRERSPLMLEIRTDGIEF